MKSIKPSVNKLQGSSVIAGANANIRSVAGSKSQKIIHPIENSGPKYTIVEKRKKSSVISVSSKGPGPVSKVSNAKLTGLDDKENQKKIINTMGERKNSAKTVKKIAGSSSKKVPPPRIIELDLGQENPQITLPVTKTTTPSHRSIQSQNFGKEIKPVIETLPCENPILKYCDDKITESTEQDELVVQKIPYSPIGERSVSPFRSRIDTAALSKETDSSFSVLPSKPLTRSKSTVQEDIKNFQKIHHVSQKSGIVTSGVSFFQACKEQILAMKPKRLVAGSAVNKKAGSIGGFKKADVTPQNAAKKSVRQKIIQPSAYLKQASQHDLYSQARKNKSFDQASSASAAQKRLRIFQHKQPYLQETQEIVMSAVLDNDIKAMPNEQTIMDDSTFLVTENARNAFTQMQSTNTLEESVDIQPSIQRDLCERAATCENPTPQPSFNTFTDFEKLLSVDRLLDRSDSKLSTTLKVISQGLKETGKPLQFFKKFFSQKNRYLKCRCEAADPREIHSQTCSHAFKWLFSKYKVSELHYLKNVYEEILRAQNDDEENVKQIEKDLARTYPDVEYFSDKGSGIPVLKRVLTAFAKYDPVIGYVQGMNFLAASLLLHAEEYVAFWLLVLLFEKLEMRDIFMQDLPGLSKHSQIIDMLISNHYPSIHQKFQELEIRVEMFCSEWILSLFTNVIPVYIMGIFFDKIFEEEWSFFYKMVLAFVSSLQRKLYPLDDFSSVLTLLKSQNHVTKCSTKGGGFRVNWMSIYEKAVSIQINSKVVCRLHSNFDLDSQRFRTSFLKDLNTTYS